MVENTQKKHGITEAAADVLAASIRNAGSEPFGLGKGQNPAGIIQHPLDLGGTHYKGDQPFVDYTKGVPTATPPGQTPPVGAEPMKTLEKDRGEEHATLQKTLGFGGKVNPSNLQNGEGGVNPDLQANSERKTNVKAYVAPGEGNKLPPWAKEAVDQILADNQQNLSDDVGAIFNGETLTEEFKTKATTIFEAAVSSRVAAIAEVLEEAAMTQLEETVEVIKAELTDQVDDYLNYMVEEWIQDNEIAVEKGLRSEIVEDFISGLRTLFVEHYIDIPEDKVDLVSELADKVDELTESLNDEITRGIEMQKELGDLRKSELLTVACEGLVQTQVEKVRTLAESVEFTTDDEYVAKIQTLRENYFPTKIKSQTNDPLNENQLITESYDDDNVVKITDPTMRSFVDTIARLNNNK